MNELALFAGAGGGILGGKLLGWTTICAVEIDDYARRVLLHQQQQGNLEPFPIWDDVCTFDGRPWRGLVDVVSGGFPCQDISAAGKGAGIDGARSGLWSEMYRIIREVRPRFAFMENSPMLTSRGLGRVLGDLAESGYDAEWLVLGAADVGAPHRRDRIWILAFDAHADLLQCTQQRSEHARPKIAAGCSADGLESGGEMADSAGERLQTGRGQSGNDTAPTRNGSPDGTAGDREASHAADTAGERCEKQWGPGPDEEELSTAERCSWWRFEPRVGRVADGVASRVDRLKCLGNGQVPLVAATAFQTLLARRLKNGASIPSLANVDKKL